VGAITESDFIRLGISRAYSDLVCLPEGVARIISLAWIGNCEIRMMEAPSTGKVADGRLFLLELFDHDGQSPVESRVCYSIDEAAITLEAFVSR
jgi:hypothetical protein